MKRIPKWTLLAAVATLVATGVVPNDGAVGPLT